MVVEARYPVSAQVDEATVKKLEAIMRRPKYCEMIRGKKSQALRDAIDCLYYQNGLIDGIKA